MAKKKLYQEVQTKWHRKLADPKDSDDPRWVRKRLEYAEVQEAKKTRSLEHKQQQRKENR